jgi:prepilin-type processing-associated H-X9-DG protein
MNLLNKLLFAKKYFKTGKYKLIVESAIVAYEENSSDVCEQRLNLLPTTDKLLAKLVEKLKGKSVYRTLKLISDGKSCDSYDMLKGLSSLLTHVVIEIKQGNVEYGMLLPKINEKINELVYSINEDEVGTYNVTFGDGHVSTIIGALNKANAIDRAKAGYTKSGVIMTVEKVDEPFLKSGHGAFNVKFADGKSLTIRAINQADAMKRARNVYSKSAVVEVEQATT